MLTPATKPPQPLQAVALTIVAVACFAALDTTTRHLISQSMSW